MSQNNKNFEKSVDKCGGIYYNENNKRTENKRFQGTVDNQFTSNKIQAKEVRTTEIVSFVSTT